MILREMELLVDTIVREVRQDLIIGQETVHHVTSTTTGADVIIPITMEIKNVILKEVHQKTKMIMDVDVMIVDMTDETIITKAMKMIDMGTVKTTKATGAMVRTTVVHHREIKSIKMEEIQDHETHVMIQEVHKVQTQEDWTHDQVQDRTNALTRDRL